MKMTLPQTTAFYRDEVLRSYGRGLGHLPSPPDGRDMQVPLGIASLPSKFDMRALADADGVKDQLHYSSCVGEAIARAVAVRARHLGKPMAEYPSACAVYTMSRQLHAALGYGPSNEPLVDNGTFPRAALFAVNRLGLVRGSRMGYSDETINFGVMWDILRAGSAGRTLDPTDGSQRCIHYYGCAGSRQVLQSLAAGVPVVFGLGADDGFMSYRSGLYRRAGRVLGGHMVCAVGYDEESVLVVNSWGEGWGEDGYVRMPHAMLDDPTITFDRSAIDVVPSFIV